MTRPALEQLCELIAGVSLLNAKKLASQFEQLLAERRNIPLDAQTHGTILMSFAYANWNFANGVWSNLSNAQLRRDLMARSKNAIILGLADILDPSHDPKDRAALAVRLDFDAFQPFLKGYLARLKELETTGVEPDARATLMFTLEWLQKKLGISESELEGIVPPFLAGAGDFSEVESVAAQVNRAAEMQKERGFWSRLFGA